MPLVTLLDTGDRLERSRGCAMLRFTGGRKTLSTGPLCGGLRDDLTAVFNYNDTPRAGAYCAMRGSTLEEHHASVARELELDPAACTGLTTAANIDNLALVEERFDDASVTALVTAGLEVNACRVGEPAALRERDGEVHSSGTVNILLVVNACLTDACMTRALVTCTEAKVAALQELMVSSRYSQGLATGSGTDGTVIVANSDSPVHLREAGEHFQLGAAIGRAVARGVKEALHRQTGLCPGIQHSVFRRVERFGVTEEAVWRAYTAMCDTPVDPGVFAACMHDMTMDGTIVAAASLYAHLLDQLSWGLLLPQEAAETGEKLLDWMDAHHGLQPQPRPPCPTQPAPLARVMTAALTDTFARWMVISRETPV